MLTIWKRIYDIPRNTWQFNSYILETWVQKLKKHIARLCYSLHSEKEEVFAFERDAWEDVCKISYIFYFTFDGKVLFIAIWLEKGNTFHYFSWHSYAFIIRILLKMKVYFCGWIAVNFDKSLLENWIQFKGIYFWI